MEKPRKFIHYEEPEDEYSIDPGLLVIGRVKIPIVLIVVGYFALIVIVMVIGVSTAIIFGSNAALPLLIVGSILVTGLLVGMAVIGAMVGIKYGIRLFRDANR